MNWKFPNPVKIEATTLLGIAYSGVAATALSAFLPGPQYLKVTGPIGSTPIYFHDDDWTSLNRINDDYARMNNVVVAVASGTATSHQALPNGIQVTWTSAD